MMITGAITIGSSRTFQDPYIVDHLGDPGSGSHNLFKLLCNLKES